ncbi:MAG: YdcF family protein, partial [Nitrospirota bacterium]|nr:YdcF family protein [Nitrospirota bacterium]
GEVATIMRDVLVSSGVPAGQVLVDPDSFSTFESAKHLAHTLAGRPFLLVTSAGHMPRAIGVFRKAGTSPLPVPTHYLTKRNALATQYFPSPTHLAYSDLAISEYAALAWYYMNGWM